MSEPTNHRRCLCCGSRGRRRWAWKVGGGGGGYWVDLPPVGDVVLGWDARKDGRMVVLNLVGKKEEENKGEEVN